MLIEKNVVLLGGSNSVMVDGLQKGIRQGIEKFNKELCTIDDKSCNLTLCNLALGITTSMQNFYELKRERNKEILENSELIITESNTNDIGYSCYEIFPLNIFYRNLYWFYQELYFLNKKILVLLLPIQWKNYKIINSIHKKLCQKFGFNFIDLQTYYQKNNLEEFGNRIDALHQMKNIMQELGKNIIKKLDDYQLPKKLSIANDNPNFIICTPKDLELVHGNLEEKKIINSMYNEIVYRINKNIKLKFPSLYSSYNLIAMHTWNQYNGNIAKDWIKLWEDYHSNLKFINKYTSLSKKNNFLNSVAEFHHLFTLDDESVVVYNQNDDADIKERSAIYPNSARVDHCDLISFFLASPEGNYHTEEIDLEALANENIEIPKEYNFNHLIPPVELYKEIIDEYCSIMDPRKLSPLQNQIKEKDNIIFALNQEKTTLQNELNSLPIKKQNLEIKNLEQDLIIKKLESKKLAKSLGIKMSIINPKITFIQANSAKSRIQNHLSYKLGQALITNSKSILGYIRMPFVLSYIKDKHRFEQKAYEEKIKENPNLALPPLESYPDYKEALKEKECFTYKLGEAFIKASKNWYGGGVYQIYIQRCA